MEKIISLEKSVHDICSKYPEAKEILVSLGFKEITNPILFNTAARKMTIPKACKMKNLNLEEVKSKFAAAGFSFSDSDDFSKNEKISSINKDKVSREELLQSYVKRLSNGENLEDVRRDFVANFSDVGGIEIANAEQSLLKSGVPLEQVQKLCDVHSALFHGATREEKIAAAEKSVEDSYNRKSLFDSENPESSKSSSLIGETGHPLNILSAENKAIAEETKKVKSMIDANQSVPDLLEETQKMRQFARHYSKKGDLLYPLLATKYDVSGPSDVMWGVDDEIRDEIGKLAKSDFASMSEDAVSDFKQRLTAVATRAEEMVYKEQNILFPICAEKFSDEEWISIAKEIKSYNPCLIEKFPEWKILQENDEEKSETKFSKADAEHILGSEVKFPSGHLKLNQLSALLNTIPMEITFVDEKDINRYFNEGKEKILKRPLLALDREVYSCHPRFIKPIVKGIIDSFRAGRKDSVERWITKEGIPLYIIYLAVRDNDGNFLGTLECVQNMTFAKKHFEKNKR